MRNTTMSIGNYLGTRLAEHGAAHLFGLPGDFNLSLLDELVATEGISWVGSSNELNAAYAADGYARAGRRLGALVTTFGVGELSAINGIAGSYAEDVPVVHVVGLPSRAAMAAGEPLHHTFLDGDFGRFVRMHREVTAALTVLDAATAGSEIDRVIGTALAVSKPVYIGVPLDLAAVPIDASPLARPLGGATGDPRAPIAFEHALRAHLRGRSEITLLVGPRVHRRGLEAEVAALAASSGVRVASQLGSKAILDEGHPASIGPYLGAQTKSAAGRRAVDDAEALILVGTVFSDFTTGGFTQGFDPLEAVELGIDRARIGHAVYPDVPLDAALRILRSVVADGPRPAALAVRVATEQPVVRDAGAALDHAALWDEVQHFLPPDSLIVAEAGTAFYGALDLELPNRSDLLGQPVWSSIGFTLPATLGGGLARPDRRPILFIGDGAAQLTVQELGSLYTRVDGAVVILIDNAGYTIERLIQSPDADYQNILGWDWPAVPAALGARDVEVAEASTVGDLRATLSSIAADRGRSWFVRVRVGRLDAPRLLAEIARGIAAQNRR